MLPEVGSQAERGHTPRITVVIPALNEERNLVEVLPRIPSTVHEVILVDGESTDGTIEAACSILPSIRIVRQIGRGKGGALRAGFEAATGDIIVMLDADGSTDPGELPAFVGALLAGADFVKGSRFLQGGGTADMTWHRKAGNGFFVRLVRLLFGGRYSDLCYGYNAFWVDVLPSLSLDGEGFEIETMMNVRALKVGLRIAEVPSYEYRRGHGVGHLRAFPDGLRVLRTILAEFGRPMPLRVPQRERQGGASWTSVALTIADGSDPTADPQLALIPIERETVAISIEAAQLMSSQGAYPRSGDDLAD